MHRGGDRSGGGPIDLWQIRDQGNGNIVQELMGTDAEIRNTNGSLKIRSSPGSALELGDTDGNGVTVENGKLSFTGSSTAQILSGSGAPTENAPDGSIYLRTDGGRDATFYVREDGSWTSK